MTLDELTATLATKTSLSPGEWADFLSCTPDQQAAIAAAYRDQSWVKAPDTFAEVLAILMVAAQVAGAVAGIGSAATILKAL